MKFHNFFKTHRYKILVGTPIIFLLLMNTGEMLESANRYVATTNTSPFLTVGSTAHITLRAESNMLVNALGGTISFPANLIAVSGVTKDTSSISLWSEEPTYSNTEGTIKFSGGIVDNKGALKNAPVLTFTVQALKAGKVTLRMQNGMLLTNNGKGTNLLSREARLLTLWIREPNAPSPDINNDGILSIADVNALYLKTFRGYDARYDLNQDGKVSWSDVKLLSSMTNP
jgi:hypothetical protein